MAALAAFFRSRNLSTDWDAVKQAADANLVTSLSMVLPFGPAEANGRDAFASRLTVRHRSKIPEIAV